MAFPFFVPAETHAMPLDTDTLQATLARLMQEARTGIARAASAVAVDQLRVQYLGKKGELTELLKQLGGLLPEERPRVGQWVNEAKEALQQELSLRRQQLEESQRAEQLAREGLDVSLPGRGLRPGGLHPISRTLRRLEALFRDMGFEVADGPEVEDDFHNFEALNIPADHPAPPADTFYFDDRRLLRTHTSPVQIRHMRRHQSAARSPPGACTAATRTSPTRPCSIRSRG